MTYRVTYTDSSKSPILVQDGEVDTTTNIGLVGRGYTGFGETIATNLLNVLENFANSNPPTRPTEGQLWYNNDTLTLSYYTNTQVKPWKQIATVIVEEGLPPDDGSEGDLYLDKLTGNIYIYNNNNWGLVNDTDETTRLFKKIRKDTNLNDHITLEVVIDNILVAIFSSDDETWTPYSLGEDAEKLYDNITPLVTKFPIIRIGINLVNRKNTPELTISDQDPNSVNVYLTTGDLWVNETSNEMFVYDGTGWIRVSRRVTIRAENPSVSTLEQSGDLWINTSSNQIFYYNAITASWDGIIANINFQIVSPTSDDIDSIGAYWVNTVTKQLYIYSSTGWIDLSPMTANNTLKSFTRVDTNSGSHETLEYVVNNEVMMVFSKDDDWEPNVAEYNGAFPTIYRGININDGSLSTRTLNAEVITGDVVATQSEVDGGVADDKVVTPATLQGRLAALGIGNDVSENVYSPVMQYRVFSPPFTITLGMGSVKVIDVTLESVSGNAVEFFINHRGAFSSVIEGDSVAIYYTIKKNGTDIVAGKVLNSNYPAAFSVITIPNPYVFEQANAKDDNYTVHLTMSETGSERYTLEYFYFKVSPLTVQTFVA